MVFGLIVCAGRQSRFKSATPKALMSVGGETILAKNKLPMAPYCDTVFTACSAENESFFPDEGKLIVTSGKAAPVALIHIEQGKPYRFFLVGGKGVPSL